MQILTAVDVLGIQRFVFASRRLRNAIGASELVRRATELHDAHESRTPDVPYALEAVGVQQNVVVSAGGNIVLCFPDLFRARDFAGRYSRWVEEHIPGLEVSLTHLEWPDGAPLVEIVQAIFQKLERAKAARLPSSRLLGLSVTAICRETGLPASDLDREGRPISAMIHCADNQSLIDGASSRWKLPAAIEGKTPRFPKEIEDLGATRGDTSTVGVVHVDGNGIGQLVIDWLKNRRADLSAYRLLAAQINGLGVAAMSAVVDRVLRGVHADFRFGAVHPGLEGTASDLRFRLTTNRDSVFLPLRPILLGGDDLTFICDGRIALDLASTALGAFGDEAESHQDLAEVGACAGVAIVHSHWPFYRAVEMAHALCRSAKKKAYEESARFAMDWHLGALSSAEDIAAMRSRDYADDHMKSPSLTLRPYLWNRDGSAAAVDWRWLENDLLGTLRTDWIGSRNKVKALSSIAREGSREVRRTLETWRLNNKKLTLPAPIAADGYLESATPLLDAIELLDVHLSCAD